MSNCWVCNSSPDIGLVRVHNVWGSTLYVIMMKHKLELYTSIWHVIMITDKLGLYALRLALVGFTQ